MAQNDNAQNKSSESSREEALAKMKERIAEDEKARQEGRPLPQARGRGISDFWIGFLATTIPIVGVSVLSTVLISATQGDLFWVWLVAVGLEVAAFITAIVLTVMHKGGIASGMWVGFGIGILALGTTCFANVINSL